MRDIGRFRKSKKVVTINKRGLILCEGETEENYFTGLITQEKYRRKFASIDVDIFKPKNHSPLGLVNKAKDPNQPEFNMSDLVSAISGGQGGGLMDAVSKYGGQFGLDQDGDGKVGMSDAVAAVSKKGGLGGLLGKLFGK